MPDTPADVRAALVTVGDEILLGKTVDTNAAWLGRRLAERGIPVVRRFTVADVTEDIQDAVTAAVSAAPLVLVTGGLGPTPDDLTRSAVAGWAGVPLVQDEDLVEKLTARFHAMGYGALPPANLSQAQVPEGAMVLHNPHGTAPGLALTRSDGLVVLLPGVPREMKGIYSGDLSALLAERFGSLLPPVFHRVIHTTGIAESVLTDRVSASLPADPSPVSIAFLPDLRGVDLRLTVRGVPEPDALRRLASVEASLAETLAPYRFEAESGDLAEAVLHALRDRHLTLAVAESCTGGLVLERLTGHAGASDVVVGGVIAYSNAVKSAQLGVSTSDLERHGAVSEPVAASMALGVAGRLGAEAGVGVTGIAGPGGGTEDKPVGTVWYAATARGRVVTRHDRFGGDRAAVRERASQAVLSLLLHLLDGRA